jgi:hypothetical protein
MNKHEVEARLHRSLASQVRAPKLDGRFDAGVWARIEAEQQKSPRIAMKSGAAAAWLSACNTAGLIVAGILVAYFGARLLNGVEVGVSVPDLSLQMSQATQQFVGWAISASAIAFGLMLTPIGRRLRSMLA